MARLRSGGRLAAIGGASTAVAVALLVLVSPFAAAAPLTVDKAPYVGAHAFYAHSFFTYGACGTAKIKVAQQFNVTSGEAVVATHAGGKNCLGANRVHTSEWLRGPVFNATSSGTFTVAFNWRVSWSASGIATRSGKFETNGGIRLLGNLFDTTTRTWVLGGATPTPAFKQLFYVSAGAWSWSGVNQTVLVSFNANLTAGNHYLFYAELDTAAWANSRCLGGGGCFGAMASVNIDVASGGNGAWLLSMTVT